MEPDLAFILEDSGVSELGRASLGRIVRTIAQFKNLADDRAAWRELMKVEFKIDESDGLAGKAEISAIISAWEAAEAWKASKDRADAEDRLMGRARSLKPNEFMRVRLNFENIYGPLDDVFAPARALVESLQQQLEEGEFRAGPLTEAPSIGEYDGEADLQPTMSKDGVVRFRRSSRMGNSAPSNPEQLRRRLRILSNAYTFVKLRHPAHSILKTTGPEVWFDYCDFLLSPRIAGLEIKDDLGRVVSTPPWHLVCSFEQSLRRKMAYHMNATGMDLRAALRAAMGDADLRGEGFTTPLAVSVRLQPTRHEADKRQKGPGAEKGRGKVKQNLPKKAPAGKSKSQGKGKQPGIKFKVKVADGSLICYAYNNPGETCSGECGKLHVCQLCESPDHPYTRCPKLVKGANKS